MLAEAPVQLRFMKGRRFRPPPKIRAKARFFMTGIQPYAKLKQF